MVKYENKSKAAKRRYMFEDIRRLLIKWDMPFDIRKIILDRLHEQADKIETLKKEARD